MPRLGKILVIGHSHMHALTSAPGVDPTFEFVSCWSRHGDAFAEKTVEDFRDMARRGFRSVVFMNGGARHIVLGMVNHPEVPFDFHWPEAPASEVDAGTRLLPAGLVERCLRRHMQPELTLVAELAALFELADLYLVESPPPLPSDYIRQYPHAFDTQVERFGVSPLPLRYKIWRLHSKIVRGHCATTRVAFIAVPREALDRDGTLAAAFRRNDPTHANGRYGDLVLNQIRALHGIPPARMKLPETLAPATPAKG